MRPDIRKYSVNGEIYDIPQADSADFFKDFPEAKEVLPPSDPIKKKVETTSPGTLEDGQEGSTPSQTTSTSPTKEIKQEQPKPIKLPKEQNLEALDNFIKKQNETYGVTSGVKEANDNNAKFNSLKTLLQNPLYKVSVSEKDLANVNTYLTERNAKIKQTTDQLPIAAAQAELKFRPIYNEKLQNDPQYQDIQSSMKADFDKAIAPVIAQAQEAVKQGADPAKLKEGVAQQQQKIQADIQAKYEGSLNTVTARYQTDMNNDIQAELSKQLGVKFNPDGSISGEISPAKKVFSDQTLNYYKSIFRSEGFKQLSQEDKRTFIAQSWKPVEQRMIAKKVKPEGILAAKEAFMYNAMEGAIQDEKKGWSSFAIRDFAKNLVPQMQAKITETDKQLAELSGFGPTSQDFPEQNRLNKQKEMLEQAVSNLQNVENMPEEDMGGFFQALGANKWQMLPFISSLSDLDNTVSLYRATKKAEEKQPLSPAEELLLKSQGLSNQLQSTVKPNFWYNAGSSVAQSLPFMGEFIATGGAFDAAKAGTLKLLNKAAGAYAEKEAVQLAVTKPLAYLVGAAAQTAANPQHWVENTIKRMSPEITFALSEKGGEVMSHIDFNTKRDLQGYRTGTNETLSEALPRAFASSFIDNYTERFGDAVGIYGKAAGKVLRPYVPDGGSELMKRLTFGYYLRKMGIPTSEAADYFVKHSIGWHGFGSEMMEEIAAMPLTNILTGDAPVMEGIIKNDKDGAHVDWENLGLTAVSVGAMVVPITTGVVTANVAKKMNPEGEVVAYRDVNGNPTSTKLTAANYLEIKKLSDMSAGEIAKWKSDVLPKLKAEGEERNFLNIYADAIAKQKLASTSTTPDQDAAITAVADIEEQKLDTEDPQVAKVIEAATEGEKYSVQIQGEGNTVMSANAVANMQRQAPEQWKALIGNSEVIVVDEQGNPVSEEKQHEILNEVIPTLVSQEVETPAEEAAEPEEESKKNIEAESTSVANPNTENNGEENKAGEEAQVLTPEIPANEPVSPAAEPEVEVEDEVPVQNEGEVIELKLAEQAEITTEETPAETPAEEVPATEISEEDKTALSQVADDINKETESLKKGDQEKNKNKIAANDLMVQLTQSAKSVDDLPAVAKQYFKEEREKIKKQYGTEPSKESNKAYKDLAIIENEVDAKLTEINPEFEPSSAISNEASNIATNFTFNGGIVGSPAKPFLMSKRVLDTLKQIGVPVVSEGDLNKKYRGVFYGRTKRIRLQTAYDMYVAAHEAAHFIDDKYKIYEDIKANAKSLIPELTRAYLEFYPNASPNASERTKIKEGIAVLIQFMAASPALIKAKYPVLHTAFFDKSGKYFKPETKAMMDALYDLAKDYASLPAVHRVGTRQVGMEDERKLREKAVFMSAWRKMAFLFFDSSDPIEAMDKLTKQRWTDNAIGPAYVQYLNWRTVVSNWLKSGLPAPPFIFQRDGSIKYAKYRVEDVITHPSVKDNLDEFGAYLIAKRMVGLFESVKQEQKNILDATADIAAIKANPSAIPADLAKQNDKIKSLEQEIKEAAAHIEELEQLLSNEGFISTEKQNDVYDTVIQNQDKFAEAEEIYRQIFRDMLEFSYQTHRISEENYNKWQADEFYAPFQRWINDEMKNSPSSTNGKGAIPEGGYMKYKGSGQDIVSPWISQMLYVESAIKSGLENMIWVKLYEAVEKNPELLDQFFTETQGSSNEEGRPKYAGSIIEFKVDGKSKFYRASHDLMQFANSLAPTTAGFVGAILLKPVMLFQKSTTSYFSPFSLCNPAIDIAARYQNRKVGASPIKDEAKSLAQLVVYFKHWVQNQQTVQTILNKFGDKKLKDVDPKDLTFLEEWLALGGENATQYKMYDITIREIAHNIMDNKKFIKRGRSALHTAALTVEDKIEGALSIASLPVNASEWFNRVIEYGKAREAGESVQLAMYKAAHSTTPFYRKGQMGGVVGQTAVRALPYLSANLNAVYKFYEEAKDNPARAAKIGTLYLASSIALLGWIMSSGSDEEKLQFMNLTPNDLSRFVYIPKSLFGGNGLARIRVPEWVGSNVTGPASMYLMAHLWHLKNSKTSDYVDVFMNQFPQQVQWNQPDKAVYSFIPHAIKAEVEVVSNRRTFPNMSFITPPYMENNVSDSLDYTKYTSDLAKAMGKEFDVSPRKIDFYLKEKLGRGIEFLRFLAEGHAKELRNYYSVDERDWAYGRIYNEFQDQKLGYQKSFGDLEKAARGTIDRKTATSILNNYYASKYLDKAWGIAQSLFEKQDKLPEGLKRDLMQTMINFEDKPGEDHIKEIEKVYARTILASLDAGVDPAVEEDGSRNSTKYFVAMKETINNKVLINLRDKGIITQAELDAEWDKRDAAAKTDKVKAESKQRDEEIDAIWEQVDQRLKAMYPDPTKKSSPIPSK